MDKKILEDLKEYKFDIIITEFHDFLKSSQLNLFGQEKKIYIKKIEDKLLMVFKFKYPLLL